MVEPDPGCCCLGVTILLSLTVFLNMVAETMPATSDAVPLLGRPVSRPPGQATPSLGGRGSIGVNLVLALP